MRAPLAPPRLSVLRKLAADAHAVLTNCGDRQTGLEHLGLQGRDVLVVDQRMVHRRDRVLPQLRLGNPRTEVARDRSHVAVQQLVPGLGECLGQLLRVIQPAPG